MIRSILPAAVFAGIACILPGHPARAADFVSGSMLAHACGSRLPTDLSSCDGYLAGVLDTVTGSSALENRMCPPAGTKLSVLREALGRFGQQHADAAHGSGVALVYAMMKADYPCPAGKG